LFQNKKTQKREKLFWHFPSYLQAYGALKDESRDPKFRTRPVSVIMKGNWKLLMFHEEWSLDGGIEKIATNNSVELYNLKSDISETRNLCNINVEKRDELLNDLLQWQKEIAAPVPEKINPQYQTN
jgi:hypothetical protein